VQTQNKTKQRKTQDNTSNTTQQDETREDKTNRGQDNKQYKHEIRKWESETELTFKNNVCKNNPKIRQI
jgi:hypothetical protein